MPKTVAIIGAGPLGRWLALAAARAGFRVLLEDVMPANLHHAREALRQQLGPEALPNVAFVSTIEDAVRDADLVIDCVPDELESKLEILWLLDRMAPPRTVLATPTTRLSIADLANCTYRPASASPLRPKPLHLPVIQPRAFLASQPPALRPSCCVPPATPLPSLRSCWTASGAGWALYRSLSWLKVTKSRQEWTNKRVKCPK